MIKPSSPAAFRLLMDGQAAFADMEMHGIRIDTDYLQKAMVETADKLQQMESDLRADPLYTDEWQKYFGKAADFDKPQQLSKLLFEIKGIVPKHFTEKLDKYGRPKPRVDEEALVDVDLPFIKKYLERRKLQKAYGTYLKDIARNTHGGYVRASESLNTVWTYRSSVSEPNLQNQPTRDPVIAKLVRSCFIPRGPDYLLVESDFSAMEFKIAAAKWQDPEMVAYASDPELDVHRDWGMACYLLKKEQVSKPCRGSAKNQYVFPTLYGSTPNNCARNMWTHIATEGLKTKDGVGIYDHLAKHGIKDLQDFTQHVFGVRDQWDAKFKHWCNEKDVWWNQYLERGWFELATGFVCQGIFSFNKLQNTPVQGPAFHCLLWSLVQINRELKQRKMRSRIILQIHDSILADVHKCELEDYLRIVKRVMTEDVRKHWTWIIVPLAIEIETSETNWFEKKPFELAF